MRYWLTLISALIFISAGAQDLVRYNPMKAEIKGGIDNFDQILQTQLTLPKNVFLSGYHDNIIAYFLVDSTGRATDITLHSGIPNAAVHREIRRLLNFFSFKRVDIDPTTPYTLTFALSKEKYNNFLKQKSKATLKIPMEADSSLIIYSKADKGPEYYKNGEEGLQEFVQTQLEYPLVALEKSVEGTVVLDFVVETNGFVSNITVRQPLGANCSEEAVRLIKTTRWQPAQLKGKVVRYKMSYPITFSLRNVTRNAASAFGQ